MKNMKKIISLLLTVCMLLSVLMTLSAIEVFAAEEEGGENMDIEDIVEQYLTKEFNSPEEKLATMTKRLAKDGYELYVDSYTGEVATKNLTTGEILFTNPYDVGTSGAVSSAKDTTPNLLSQIIISYSDSEGNTKTLTSFTEAAMRGQIKVKNIKNGVRVEYTIGRVETKYLAPRVMTEDRYLKYIKEPLDLAAEEGLLDAWDCSRIVGENGYYQRKDPEGDALVYIQNKIPTDIGPIYVFKLGETASAKELTFVEQYIKAFCTEYSYEELDYDHIKANYESTDKNPANFKMALEYKLDKMGVTVTLPASGIRFNQSMYTLEALTVLPYMGAGAYSKNTPNDGYIFFPDGSGTLFEFEPLSKSQSILSVGGMVYGEDYAYQTLQGAAHQEVIRYPVYGIAQERKELQSTGYEEEVVSLGSQGFVAIIEEGDSMAELRAISGGTSHKYFSVEMSFYPRPKDTYILSDAISVGSNNEWTVISSRKYTGNYTVRYIMLSDSEKSNYDATWVGMAQAYQDYLVNAEVLKPLSEDKLDNDLPLYIESFGATKTTQRVLGIPLEVMTPMTTFEDIKTMYKELSDESLLGENAIDNVIFKLTGFANGGLYSRVPYHLNWEGEVGGDKGFKDLLDFANGINSSDDGHLGLFPDFDFSYIKETGLFDGLSYKDHAVKTIDNRYSSKRYYSATKQTYISYFELAISPAYFDHFYTKLTENYIKYSLVGNGSDLGMSVSSLGTDINSDFDEDEPYNREDSKKFTIGAFEYFDEKYGSVMTDGANAYAWKYIDHILNMPLTSSRYLESSATVPFMGMVLHGFVQYAGAPLNMEGNTNYALLKAIENGASVYFTLSYRNTDILKEDTIYNKYYSIRYNIWVGEKNDDGVFEYGELIELYNELNKALADLQTSNLIDHKFVNGIRIPTSDEAEQDKLDQDKKDEMTESERLEQERIDTIKRINEVFFGNVSERVLVYLEDALAGDGEQLYASLCDKYDAYLEASDDDKDAAYEELVAAYEAYSGNANAYKAYTDAYSIYLAYQHVNEMIAQHGEDYYSESFKNDIAAKLAIAESVFEKLGDMGAIYDAVNAETESDEVDKKYIVNDDSIVLVTYGKGTEAEKTFILNYNYFDVEVEVEYNGKTITATIPAYGYVVEEWR